MLGHINNYCNRLRHLVKTFWGRDQQLPDATVIWVSPAGHT